MKLSVRASIVTAFFLSVLALSSSKAQRLALEQGKWRGVFQTQGTEIPFNFSVEDDAAGMRKVFLTNADEKTVLDGVRYDRDSVIIAIDLYDAVLIGKLKPNGLSGYFRKNQSTRQGIPFEAVKGSERFKLKNQATSPASVNGTWSVNFINAKNEKRYTVGLLKQQGTTVTGTILTTTGDYRYLQGVVDGDSIKLSGFSGSNPYLLVAKLSDNTHFFGDFVTVGGRTRLEAVKSDTAKLPDPYSLTKLNPGQEKLAFTFPDIDGKPISLADDKFKGKVVVVTLQGTWCPNCVDEAAFLSPWYKQNRNRGVEIIGLSFERKDDAVYARERIGKFIKRFDIQYDVLFAGPADKKFASEKLPALSEVLSFPTTILIDKAGNIRKIHTGFTGPATGEHYQEFIKHFNEDVTALLEESVKPVKIQNSLK